MSQATTARITVALAAVVIGCGTPASDVRAENPEAAVRVKAGPKTKVRVITDAEAVLFAKQWSVASIDMVDQSPEVPKPAHSMKAPYAGGAQRLVVGDIRDLGPEELAAYSFDPPDAAVREFLGASLGDPVEVRVVDRCRDNICAFADDTDQKVWLAFIWANGRWLVRGILRSDLDVPWAHPVVSTWRAKVAAAAGPKAQGRTSEDAVTFDLTKRITGAEAVLFAKQWLIAAKGLEASYPEIPRPEQPMNAPFVRRGKGVLAADVRELSAVELGTLTFAAPDGTGLDIAEDLGPEVSNVALTDRCRDNICAFEGRDGDKAWLSFISTGERWLVNGILQTDASVARTHAIVARWRARLTPTKQAAPASP